MKPVTIARILRHQYLRGGVRSAYWAAAAVTRELRALVPAHKQAFRSEVIRSQWQFATAMPQPVHGETQERARAAVQWLLQAQAASPDDGVSLGYFPCDSDKSREGAGWRASYPETTGYIITSLLAFSAEFDDAAVAAAAMRMAAWETAVQMPSGAVQGGPVCPPERQTAAIFNTGMVLDGWCSAYRHSGDPKLMVAARKAADFLVGDLDEQGYFKTNGAFVSAGEIKTYSCLCAWSIYRFGELAQDESYQRAAVRVIEAALRQQQPNGWFAHNCLTHSDAPLTHTIGYTLQGVLEVGALAGRPDFIHAVRRSVDAILPRIESNGYLPGRFYADWEPAGFSSCLTGSAQIAIVAYRLFDLTGQTSYRLQADKLVDFLKALQLRQSDDAAVVGALAGSFPLMGSYMRAGYPNWATKYLLDALLLQQRFDSAAQS
ncbi:MAG: hypothetical protein KJ614_01030 [Gammaproteobacteria bacterium]|uniref:hypothetical protein n=1 Tax=Rhodoferax sp. TaxID=50421 RepID=UPI0017E51438|nr:hypothetical protein [Rhodoferax sp.]MBU3897507.1 hypothetical protein [Gammaproteobacteria bacterium]MBA3058015.1 hypothetical protein [Rhodoferax sp.]MBU3998822.1 hypothetical protein [Gammaproteobacteria bacterium]MBU4018853.1 hypothetical protein [Gammaproteobacteria bacterium]MBU4079808.1 hypothetical protein [Gammaproteobacteria bacterium]